MYDGLLNNGLRELSRQILNEVSEVPLSGFSITRIDGTAMEKRYPETIADIEKFLGIP